MIEVVHSLPKEGRKHLMRWIWTARFFGSAGKVSGAVFVVGFFGMIVLGNHGDVIPFAAYPSLFGLIFLLIYFGFAEWAEVAFRNEINTKLPENVYPNFYERNWYFDKLMGDEPTLMSVCGFFLAVLSSVVLPITVLLLLQQFDKFLRSI